MFTELFLAGRYLRISRHGFSWITFTSIIGVTLGVAVLIIVIGVMTGFTDLMKAKLVETQAHFQIRYRYGAMRDSEGVRRIVEKNQGSAAAVIQAPVLVQFGRRNLDTNVVAFAFDEKDFLQHMDVEKMMISGKPDVDDRHVVISSDMARRWRIGVGDKILIHSTEKLTDLVKIDNSGKIQINKDGAGYMPTEFVVSGIYSIGKSDFDRIMLFIGLDDAAELLGLPWGSATSIFGWGADPFDQGKLTDAIRRELPQGYILMTWEESNQKLLDVLAVEKRMMFFLLIFIVLVAAFSIANTLITSVYQKTKEIGVLKALGAGDGTVMRIFLYQGLLIGTFGSIFGTIAGYLILKFRNDIINFFSKLAGHDLFPKEFYFFNEMPARIVVSDVLIIVGASILLCTLGAIIPAMRAARLDPAKALRYE